MIHPNRQKWSLKKSVIRHRRFNACKNQRKTKIQKRKITKKEGIQKIRFYFSCFFRPPFQIYKKTGWSPVDEKKWRNFGILKSQDPASRIPELFQVKLPTFSSTSEANSDMYRLHLQLPGESEVGTLKRIWKPKNEETKLLKLDYRKR